MLNDTLNSSGITEASSPSDAFAWTAHDIIAGISFSVMTIIVVLGNVICMIGLQNTRIKHTTRILMYSLTAADICVGIFNLFPIAVASFTNTWILGHTTCFIAVIIGGAPYYTSIWTLVAMAVERYIAVTKPLQYRVIFTVSRARTIVMSIWLTSHMYEVLVCGLQGFQVYFDPLTDQCWSLGTAGSDSIIKVVIIVLIFGPFVAFSSLYIRIYLIIRHQAARRRAMFDSVSSIPQASENNNGISSRDMRAAKTFMFITLSFSVAIIPLSVLFAVENITKTSSNEWVYFVTTLTALSNSWINTFIYFFRDKSFKNSVANLFGKTYSNVQSRSLSSNW